MRADVDRRRTKLLRGLDSTREGRRGEYIKRHGRETARIGELAFKLQAKEAAYHKSKDA